jgi:CubicO group peptidase (beta-lactamase class C family)
MTTRILTGILSAALITGMAPVFAQDSEFPGMAATDAIEAAIADGRYGTVTSVMVLEHGEVRVEAYFNGANATTLHDTRSATKTITGMVAGAAIADGHLALDTPVADLFADLQPFANPDPRKQAITVEDLLTMSSVMECNDWNQFSRGNEERMYLVEDWSRFFWNLPVRGFPAWQTPPEASPHGRAFSYCTAGVQLLGEAVERAVGQPFTAWAEARLLDPLGIDRLEWPMNGQGQAHMGGGLRLTAAGLAQLAELQRLGGEIDGQRLLPESWTRAAISRHAVIPDSGGWEYGYLWWIRAFEVDGETYWTAAMSGNGGNRVYVLPDFGLTVVFTNTDYNTRQMHAHADAFFEEQIVARLQGTR